MIAGFALGSDNKRYFRGNLPRLAMITIILMPLLYCALYLWTFWNPFNEVQQIPAAVVNLDRGAKQDGKPFDAGKQVVTNLIKSGQLGVTEVSESEAADGLADGEYYYTITIPANFSKAIVSPTAKDAFRGEIKFEFNDANNYLMSVIGKDVAETVINQVNETIGDKLMHKVLVKVQGAIPKLEQAAAGVDKLAAGSAELNNGMNELKTQLDQVLVPALAQLESGRIGELNAQVASVARQAETLLPLAEQTMNGPLAAAADSAVGFLNGLPDPEAKQIARDLRTAGQATSRDVAAASQAARQVSVGLSELEQKLNVQGSGSLQSQLAGIEAELRSKLETLQAGLAKLASGTGQLNGGIGELQAAVNGGLSKVPHWTPRQVRKLSDTLSTPVNLRQQSHNIASTFGTGFAPFFIGLAMFVGALLCWMLLTPLQSRPIISGVNPLRTALLSYLPALLVGALQAIVLFLVVNYVLGVKAVHPLGMCLFMILMSATFLAIIQAFNAVFDIAIGRVTSLAFLMLWLVSSGGIYPVPVTAKPFQVIHPFDPMTYTVNGLRQLTVAQSPDARLWVAVAVLTGIVAAGLLVTAWAARRNRQYTMERLHPSIEV